MRPVRSRGRGAALILVLWLVAALSLVVTVGAQGVRLHTQRIAVELERMRAEGELDVAIQLLAQRLMASGERIDRYQWWSVDLGGRSIRLETVPASGLVDVNVASEALLQALLHKVGGLQVGEAAILTARIRDFIDPDDEPSGPGGAEAPQYRAAGRTVMPRNGALDDLSELQMVLGMTPELYGIISPFLSINGQARLAINAAPPELIDLLSGQPGLGARMQAQAGVDGGEQFLGAFAELFAPGSSGQEALRIRAFSPTDDGGSWQREAWVELRGRPDTLTPWTTLSLEPTRRMDQAQQERQP